MDASEAEYGAAVNERKSLLSIVDSYFSENDLWILPVAMGEAIRRQPRGDDIVVNGRPVPYPCTWAHTPCRPRFTERPS